MCHAPSGNGRMGANFAPACIQTPQVSEASRRGKAASTRKTRYIALHPRYCAGFSAVRVSEMLHSRARRADDRTTTGRREGGREGGRGCGGGDNAISTPIRNCRRLFGRHSRNEHKILRLFRRYLASCTPRIERSKYPLAILFTLLPSAPPSPRCVSTAPLDPYLGPRRISHITFRVLHLLHLFLPLLLLLLRSECSYALARDRV